jgi:uncharacterized membrane protein YccC
VIYLGAFAAIFAFFSFCYFRAATRQLTKQRLLGTYVALLGISVLAFYIT